MLSVKGDVCTALLGFFVAAGRVPALLGNDDTRTALVRRVLVDFGGGGSSSTTASFEDARLASCEDCEERDDETLREDEREALEGDDE